MSENTLNLIRNQPRDNLNIFYTELGPHISDHRIFMASINMNCLKTETQQLYLETLKQRSDI